MLREKYVKMRVGEWQRVQESRAEIFIQTDCWLESSGGLVVASVLEVLRRQN